MSEMVYWKDEKVSAISEGSLLLRTGAEKMGITKNKKEETEQKTAKFIHKCKGNQAQKKEK